MSDYVLIPVSETEAARVQLPLALPRDERADWLAALPDAVLDTAERVPLPLLPTED